METVDKSVIRVNNLYDTIGDVSRNLEKILAIIDQLNDSYFGTPGKPSLNAVMSWLNRPIGTRATDDERLSYEWVVFYSQIQSFFEIVEDYVRTSKEILDAKQEEGRNNQTGSDCYCGRSLPGESHDSR